MSPRHFIQFDFENDAGNPGFSNLDTNLQKQKELQPSKAEEERSHSPTVNQVCSKRKPFILLKDARWNPTVKKSKRSTGCEEKTPLPKNSHEVPKKPPQSKMKNIPGHTMNAMKRSIKDCLENPPGHHDNRHRAYIFSVLEERKLSQQDKDNLLEFLENMNSQWKTWKAIIGYLAEHPDYAGIFVHCIEQFLGDRGYYDFNEWLVESKMNEATEIKIRDNKKKEKLLRKFRAGAMQ